VLDSFRIAGVIEGVAEGPGEPDALVELADGEQPCVAGELAGRRLGHERRTEEVQDLWPGGGYTHGLSPGGQDLVAQQVRHPRRSMIRQVALGGSGFWGRR
jgi:hypothetical protein